MDVALEAGHLREKLGLLDDRFVASSLDDASLVGGYRAEAAFPEAAPVACDAELYLVEGGYAARGVVVGVPGARVGQGVYPVHLRRRERARGAVLHDVPGPLVLNEPLAAYTVVLVVEELEGGGELCLVGAYLRKGAERHGVVGRRRIVRLPAGARDIPERGGLFTVGEAARDLQRGALAHAIYEKVCAAVRQD